VPNPVSKAAIPRRSAPYRVPVRKKRYRLLVAACWNIKLQMVFVLSPTPTVRDHINTVLGL
jgi:hypothetical protein